MPEDVENSQALDQCEQARKLWLAASSLDELEQVESLYKSALNAKSSVATAASSSTRDHASRKRRRRSYAALSPTEYRKAGERLSLLYCQSGRSDKAKKGLDYLGFTCRLAKDVLDYPMPSNSSLKSKERPMKSKSKNNNGPPCMILDDFLHPRELKQLQGVFLDPEANYWTDHSYKVEPPTPYFSYVLDLKDVPSSSPSSSSKHRYGFIGELACRIQQLPVLQSKFPQLRQARFVELWAHNRPHASGHQLHFDSDDEGRGGMIRNPVCSTILYLTSEEDDHEPAGGPSLVTNQRLSSSHLATKGWLAHPKSRRLVVFDGTVLHGVIPGKGVHTGRRVTLMLAFWKQIQVRNEPGPGSARPFPTGKKNVQDQQSVWAKKLMETEKVARHRPSTLQEYPPISLSTVYETLDGQPWSSSMGMPDYEQVFQGF